MKRAYIAILFSILMLVMSFAATLAQEQPKAAATPTETAAPAPTTPATTPSPTPESPSAKTAGPSDDYLIQSEDVLRMSVLGESELSTEQVVDPKGCITVPLVGSIHAEGLTRKDLVDKISAGLAKYLVEPKVELTLAQFRHPKIYVLGMVNRPGMVEFRAGDRVMEAIAQSGSFRDDAYLDGATLTHAGSTDQVKVDLHKLFFKSDMSQNLTLQDGDTIYVPEDTTNRYFVLGEVNHPGKFQLKDNVTVVDAITSAGGVTTRASSKTAYIIRGDPKKPQRIPFNVNKFLKSADMSQNMALLPGDVIYVPETNKPDWSKMAGILSVIVNTSYLARFWGF